MPSYFFLDLDPHTFTFLRVTNVFVFDLDRIDCLGEVGVFSLNVDNVSNVELATCEFDDAHTKMGIVVGYTTERFFFRLRGHGWILLKPPHDRSKPDLCHDPGLGHELLGFVESLFLGFAPCAALAARKRGSRLHIINGAVILISDFVTNLLC